MTRLASRSLVRAGEATRRSPPAYSGASFASARIARSNPSRSAAPRGCRLCGRRLVRAARRRHRTGHRDPRGGLAGHGSPLPVRSNGQRVDRPNSGDRRAGLAGSRGKPLRRALHVDRTTALSRHARVAHRLRANTRPRCGRRSRPDRRRGRRDRGRVRDVSKRTGHLGGGPRLGGDPDAVRGGRDRRPLVLGRAVLAEPPRSRTS